MPKGSGKKKMYKDATAKKTKYRKRAAIQPVSKAVRSYVNRAIGAHSENKNAPGITALDAVLASMLPASWGTVLNLADVWGGISQGTGEGSRIGNIVRPINWSFKGFIHNNGTTAVPCVVKMFIIKIQNGYQSPVSTLANPTNFFNLGNSTVAPGGSYLDMLRKVNKDQFVLYTTRTFKVGPASAGTTSPNSTNNDMKTVCPFSINLLKYQKHHMRYADATVTNPTNAGLFAVFSIAPADGSSGAVINGPQISYDVEAVFEDA